jgi:hypothetical protein
MDNLIPFLAQLAGQTPILLVYLVGMILALVFWRRCPGPCVLTVVAAGLLFVTTLVQPFLFHYLVRVRAEHGWGDEKLGWLLLVNALFGGVFRAVAFGLLLAAVFIGRKGAPQTRPNRGLQPTEPASELSEEYGITGRPGG